MMSSIIDEKRCFLLKLQSNFLELLILKEQVAFSDDLFKTVRGILQGASYFVRFAIFFKMADCIFCEAMAF